MKIKLLVDSTCDLPVSFLEENDIDIIPLIVTFGEEQFYDIKEINTFELYEKIEKTKVMPKTAARSINDFYNTYWCFDGISNFTGTILSHSIIPTFQILVVNFVF